MPTAAYATDASDEDVAGQSVEVADGTTTEGESGDATTDTGDAETDGSDVAEEPQESQEPQPEESAEPEPEETTAPVEETEPSEEDEADDAQEVAPTTFDPAGTLDPRFTASKISSSATLTQVEMDKLAMSVGDDPAVLEGGFTAERSLAGFNAANIVSDSVLYDGDAMTQSQISSFLDSKVKTCRSGYTCLPDYTEVTKTRSSDTYCTGYSGGKRESSATIIYKVAKACDINPKALIVILQKEQGLVTHTWPSSWRYTIAMGMACPDTSACDSKYYGFQNQVYSAARQYQVYTKSSYFSWYPVGKSSAVRYNPKSSCGSSNLTIANKATAALYYYTPYQPNRAALAAGYGTGDSCSAYGNRNFYNYFTDWFGSTHQGSNPCTVPSGAKSTSVTYVTTAGLNARKAPNTGCGTGVFGIDKGTIVKASQVSADGDWVKVRTNAGSRWVSKQYLKKATAAQSKCSISSGTTSASGTYVVTTSTTARYAPWDACTMSPRAVQKGTAVNVKRVSSSGNWVQISTGIGDRWIRVSSLSKCSAPAGTSSTGEQYVVAATSTKAYQYAGAKCTTGVNAWGKDTTRANTVKQGTLVQATKVSKTGNWIQIRTSSGLRWVQRSDLTGCGTPTGTTKTSGEYEVSTKTTTAYVSPFAKCSSQVKFWGTGTGHRTLHKGWVLHATAISKTGKWIRIDTSTGLLWVRESDIRKR